MNRGQQITEAIRAFNDWKDDFLLELSMLLLLLGMCMGTVDIFVRGTVATSPWFSVSWAIVQAISIDGLFFAVWGKIARLEWTRKQLARNIPMVAVGCVLALVAILINAILSYQQLNGIADSLIAMQRLHMDATGFTLMRAVLVVAVAILVSLFCRNRETLARVQPVPSVQVQAASQVSAMIEGTAQSVTSMDVHPARVHAAEQETPIETPVQEDMDTDRIRVFPVHSVPPQAEQECTGETIEEQVRKLLSEQPGISVRKLANALNMPPSTANNWIKRVRNQQTEEVG